MRNVETRHAKRRIFQREKTKKKKKKTKKKKKKKKTPFETVIMSPFRVASFRFHKFFFSLVVSSFKQPSLGTHTLVAGNITPLSNQSAAGAGGLGIIRGKKSRRN